MNDEFVKNALSRGEDGRKWLRDIPSLVTEYENKWSIKAGKPFSLTFNYVAPVEQANGSQAVLKIGFPGDKEFQTEIAALRIFDGKGCVKLLKSEAERSVILIEQAIPGSALSTVEDDELSTKILADVMTRLHRPLPAQHQFITPKEWSGAIDRYLERDSGPIPRQVVMRAQELFKTLIATSTTPSLIHGDLHHDNILYTKEDGWIAIDPKGIAGEPAYEVAAMIRNPYDKLKKIDNLAPLLERRIKILTNELGIPPKRVWQWCFAQTVLSAVWSVDEAEGPEHAARVAHALLEIEAQQN